MSKAAKPFSTLDAKRRNVMCASAMKKCVKMAGSATCSPVTPAAKEAIDRIRRRQLSYKEALPMEEQARHRAVRPEHPMLPACQTQASPPNQGSMTPPPRSMKRSWIVGVAPSCVRHCKPRGKGAYALCLPPSSRYLPTCDPQRIGLGGFVTTYRCFLVSGERIRSIQIFECASDSEVGVKATALLNSKPEHQGIEIWQAGRLVVRIPSRAGDAENA